MFIMTNNFACMQEQIGGENNRMNHEYFEFKDIYLNIINMINREGHGWKVLDFLLTLISSLQFAHHHHQRWDFIIICQ